MERLTLEFSGSRLRVNDTWFDLDITPTMMDKQSTDECFVLAKTQKMIETLVARTNAESIQNVFDVGIFKGGSVALYNELFSPKKLVAIEINPQRIEALDSYVARGRAGIVPLYGVDQSDTAKLKEILEEQFGPARLDIVVDDASHLYEQTKASFNVLFPRLRSGGLYVIEDWAWSHWPGDVWQKPKGHFMYRQPLSRLIFEITMTCASSLQGVVRNVHITGNSVFVERGDSELPINWDISNAFLSQGKSWGPERYSGASRRIKRYLVDSLSASVRQARNRIRN